MNTRIEADSIGTLEVPAKAYYGVQTLRAKHNFNITGRPLHPVFINNLARIKKAAAMTNMAANVLERPSSRPVTRLSRENSTTSLSLTLSRAGREPLPI